MDLYTNTRAWRAHLLLWLFLVGGVGFAVLGLVGWQNGDPTGMEAGLIAAPILLLAAIAMEFYCRRYITALRVQDGAFVLETRSATGRHQIQGTGTLGDRLQDGGFDLQAQSAVPGVVRGLAFIEYRSNETHYHILRVGERQRRYILDVTADPDAEARIQRALRASRKSSKKKGAKRK